MGPLQTAEAAPKASPAFFAALHASLPGELARFQAGLAGPDDPRPGVTAPKLLDDAMMTTIVARFDARFGPTDPRAIVSMWSAIGFTETLPPLLAANITLDLEPELSLDRAAFVLSPTHRIEALKITGALRSVADTNAGTRFEGLVSGHLAPFIDLVARRGRVTRRVLWSNAGNVFEAFCRKLEAMVPDRPGLLQAREFLGRRTLPDGTGNPLFEPVRYVQGKRIRRVCCMRYLVPNEKVCGVCPLPPGNPARGVGGRAVLKQGLS